MRFLPTPGDIRKANRHKLSKRGIVNPTRLVWAARKAGLPLAYACAMVEKESGGGHNVFGHDPVRSIVGGNVTKGRYLYYKKRRKQGLGMQGVGPTQLTWYSYQDEADSLGGCWKQAINMYVGFKLLNSHIKAKGLYRGAMEYNGSGPAALAYARDFEEKAKKWEKLFKGDK